MLNVAIIEDSEKDAKNLQNNLMRYGQENRAEIKINIFDNVRVFLLNYKPVYDIIFMDIMMPYINGLDAAKELREKDKKVPLIFVTDMAQYAIKGYSVNAMDFFVKPIVYYDLKLRMDTIRMQRELSAPTISIKIPYKGVKIISSDDVYYIEVLNKEIIYHTVEGNYTVRSSGLKNLEAEISDAGFVRCSSSYLVNLKWCTALKNDTVIVAGNELKISRGQKKEFVTELSKSLALRFRS